MKLHLLLAALALGVSAVALADSTDTFEMQNNWHMSQPNFGMHSTTAPVVLPGSESAATVGAQPVTPPQTDLFEMNNNWHVGHSSR